MLHPCRERRVPNPSRFSKGGNLDCRYGGVWGLLNSHMLGAVVTPPLQRAQGWAASVAVAQSRGQPSRPSRLLRYTPPVHNEHALIAAFVKRSKRDR